MSARRTSGGGWQRTRIGAQGYSRFIGRVGALAVALGVGVGFTTTVPGLAWADDTDSSSSADSSSTNSASGTSDTKPATDTTTSTSTATGSDTSTKTSTTDGQSVGDRETGMVQSSGGAHTGSYGPSAAAPNSDDDTDTEPTSSNAPEDSEPTETGSAASTGTGSPDTGATGTGSPDTGSTDTGATDDGSTDTGSTNTPEPSPDPDAPQTPAPQDDSTTDGTTSATAPPPATVDVEPGGNSNAFDVLDGTTSPGSGTGQGQPSQFRLFTASAADDPTDNGPQLLAASDPQDNSAFTLAQNTSLAAPPNPLQALMALPGTVVNIAAGFVAAILSPFLAPGPVTPAQPPLMLFAVLDWLRREIQQTFFNRTPNAVANVYTTSEDVGLSGNVLTNDTDADGDELTATLVAGPAHGDVTLNADGSFTYTPDANYNGADTFTYKVSDETSGWHLHGLFGFLGADGGHTDTATVTINITAVNDAPVAVDDAVTTAEDTQASGNVLGNDTDVDSGSLTAVLGAAPANGTAVVNADGTFTYTPNANFAGTDTFAYTVSDGAATDTGIVTVTVVGVNDAPVAQPDAVYGPEDFPEFSDNVLSNDSDADGDSLTAQLVSGPSNAAAFNLNADGSFTYTPSTDFVGEDTFTYRASDGTTMSDVAIVHIFVGPSNDDVVARDDTKTTSANHAVSGNVLTNDVLQNPDGPSESLTVTTTGSIPTTGGGSVVMASDGFYTYTPATDFTGVDTFAYTVTDGLSSDIGQVSITVTPAGQLNNPPVAANDELSTDVDTPLVLTADDLLANDIDADGDSLTIVSVIPPTNGTFTDGGNGTVIYTPNAGFTGTDTFYYTAFDGQDLSNLAAVTITVGDVVSNIPPVAGDDELFTDVNTPLTILPDDLLGNDSDPDGDITQVGGQIIDQPHNGTLDSNEGSIVYTPDPGFVGTDTFTYQLDDGQDVSNIATVTITVGERTENSAPVPGYDSLATAAGMPITIHDDDLLANDFDADGDPLTVTITEAPTTGLLVLNPDGTHTYTPAAGFTGTDTFAYTLSDGQDDSAYSAVVTINVGIPPNTAPTANADNLTTPIDTPLTITDTDLVGNDFDANADTLTSYVISQPANGTVEYNPDDDTYTYTPDAGFTGTDTFYYTAFDGTADSTPTAVTISVGGVVANTPPVAENDEFSTDVDTPLVLTAGGLLANDFDADGDALTIVSATSPMNGTFTDGGNGTVIYTPNAGFTGTDTFYYTAFDGQELSNLATVSIIVGEPTNNTAPVPGYDSLATAAGTPITIHDATLLANDFDADADTLTVTITEAPATGILVLNPDGTHTYTPAAGFTGTDTFAYTVSDGQTDSEYSAVVTINIGIPPNTAPTANPDNLTTPLDTPLTITDNDLVGNDFDPNADTLTTYVVSQPANGTVEYNELDDTYTYTPVAGFTGTDTFHYTAFDGQADSTPTTVTVTIDVANTSI